MKLGSVFDRTNLKSRVPALFLVGLLASGVGFWWWETHPGAETEFAQIGTIAADEAADFAHGAYSTNPDAGDEGSNQSEFFDGMEGDSAVDTADLDAGVEAESQAFTWYSGNFEEGNPFFNQMVKLGLSGAEIQALVALFKPVYSFRKSRPHHRWQMGFRDDRGSRFILEVSRTEIYDVFDLDLEPQLRRRQTETFNRFEVVRANVGASLFQSLSHVPDSAWLAMQLAEIFAWDIDFYKDPRRGDSVEILVETTYVREEEGATFHGYNRVLAARYVSSRETFDAFLFEVAPLQFEYFASDGKSLVRDVLRSPLKFQRITSSYNKNRFHPILKKRRPHNGVDYGAPLNTPVMAVASGRVVRSGRYGGAGIAVEIQHSGDMLTQYFHLNKIAPGIRKGAHVRQGEVIGYVGKTGYATAYHLHFGMRIRGQYVDPMGQRFQPGTPLPAKSKDNFFAKVGEYGAYMDSQLGIGQPRAFVRAPDLGQHLFAGE